MVEQPHLHARAGHVLAGQLHRVDADAHGDGTTHATDLRAMVGVVTAGA